MKSNVEIELKLLVEKEDLQKLLTLPLMEKAIRQESKTVRRLVTSYYDTEDMILQNNGIAYRVRDKGDGTFEATVKTAKKNTGGVTERVELNIPLAKNEAVLEGFKELGLGVDLLELVPNGVEKLFTVDVIRTTYLLDIEGAVVELAIDKGNVIAGELKDEIDEIELELKDGETPALLKFAATLSHQIPLFVELKTKYARGLALRNIPAKGILKNAKISAPKTKEDFLAAIQQVGNRIFEQQIALKKNSSVTIEALVDDLKELEGLLINAECILNFNLNSTCKNQLKELITKCEQNNFRDVIQQGKFTAAVYEALSQIANFEAVRK